MTRVLLAVVVLVPLFAGAAFSDFDQPKWLLLGLFGLATGLWGTFRRRDASGTTVDPRLGLAALGLLTLASLIGAGSQTGGLWTSFRELAGLAVTFGAFLLAAEAHARRGATRELVIAGALVPPLLLLAQLAIESGAFPVTVPHRPGLLTSTLGNSGLLAECLAAHLGFALIALGRGRLGAAVGVASLAAIVAGLIYADARAGVLALLVGAIVYVATLIFGRQDSGGLARRVAAWGLGAGAAVTLLIALLQGRGFEIPDLGSRLATVTSSDHPTNRVRLELWSDALAMWRDHPLAGVGPGRFGLHHSDYRSAAEWELSGVASHVRSPHSEPLRALAEGGLLGALALLLVVGGVLFALLRRLRSPEGADAKEAAAALATVAAIGVFALAWFPFRQPATLLPLAVLLGITLGRSGHGKVGAKITRDRVIAFLVAAAGALLLVFAEADAAAVESRDDLETAKRGLAESMNRVDAEPGEDYVSRLAAAGAEARRCLRTSRRATLPPTLRYRLLLAASDLIEQVPRVEATARDIEDAGVATALRGATRAFPDQRELIESLEAAHAAAPRHLGLDRLFARTQLRLGRKPEVLQRFRTRLEVNPDTPLLRADLALLYRVDAERAREEGNATLATSFYDRVRTLLTEELLRYPNGPEADAHWEARIRVTGRQGELGPARDLVEDWVRACGDSELRWSLAGELALRFGETGDTLGRFRTASEGSSATAERREAVAALDGLEPVVAHRRLLALLGRAPDDVDVLAALERVLGELVAASRDPEVIRIHRRDRKRAIARVKVLYAAEQIEAGELRLARVNLRLARRSRPRQGDAWLLTCLEQLRRNDEVRAIATLQEWRQTGFDDPEALRVFPEIEPLLSRPELAAWSEGAR